MKEGKNGQNGAFKMPIKANSSFAHSANNRMFTLSR